MSDYRIKVSIRNNRLLKAMEAKGFKSVAQFERSYKFNHYFVSTNTQNYDNYDNYENDKNY